MNNLARRLIFGVGANVYNQLASIAAQVLFVPFFLIGWGAHTYGQWLTLITLPVLISIASTSTAIVVGNLITSVSNSPISQEKDAEIFSDCWKFFFAITTGLALALLILVLWARDVMKIDVLDVPAYTIAIVLLCAVFEFQNEMAQTALRAVGQYSLGLTVASTAFLIDGAVTSVSAMLGQSLGSVAIIHLGIVVTSFAVLQYLVRRQAAPFANPYKKGNFRRGRNYLSLVMSYLGLPGSQIVMTQGLTLVIGATLGPASVTLFNTHRTLARVIGQAVRGVSNAFWPELTALIRARNFSKAKRVYKVLSLSTLALSVLSALMLILVGEHIYIFWTKGKVEFDSAIFSGFIILLVIQSLSIPGSTLIKAANSHQSLSRLSVILCLITVLIFSALIGLGHLTYAIYSLGIQDIIILIFVAVASKKVLY